MILNCFSGRVERTLNSLALLPSGTIARDPPGFEPAQNLILGIGKRSCTVLITTTPWCHNSLRLFNILGLYIVCGYVYTEQEIWGCRLVKSQFSQLVSAYRIFS